MKSVDLLSNQYEALRANSVNGIDIAAMQRETICFLKNDDGVFAIPFDEPWKSIRLIVAPLNFQENILTEILLTRDEFTNCLKMQKKEIFETPVPQLHITLYHLGRPGDPRLVDDTTLAKEIEEIKRLSNNTSKFSLMIDSFILSNTGVLLLLFQTIDGDDTAFTLRNEMRSLFPSSPTKQTSILHSSLARILDMPNFENWQQALECCNRATMKLRGTIISFDKLWYVIERALPIDGEIIEIALNVK